MRSRAGFRLPYGAMLAALAIIMSGCSFEVSVPVLKDIVLPGQSSIGVLVKSPEDAAAGDKIVLGPSSLGELCGFESTEVFQETVLTELEGSLTGIPALLVGVMKVTGVLLDEVELAASEGDFSTITRIVMDLRVNGESTGMFVSDLGEGEAFGSTIRLKGRYDLLEDTGGDCVEPFYTLEGDIPEQDVVFDLIMHLTVKYRIALF